MEIVRMKPKMLCQKLIPNITREFAQVYNIPPEHKSCAFFSTDNDDIGYVAVDDATKKAKIKVNHAKTYYGGMNCSWSRNGGGVFIMFSGEKVADVKSGLSYVRDFVENHSALYNFDGDEGTAFYLQTIPRAGKYFLEWCDDIQEGQAYTYLAGGPIETNYALDKALKASDTKIAKFWYPPSNANSSGAVLCGTESACKSAEAAFIDALRHAISHPLEI